MSLPEPVDNCGECLTRESAVTCRPYLVQPDGDGGVRASYRCSCGHRWWTSWNTRGMELLWPRWEGAA
jgi:hypothetical protein